MTNKHDIQTQIVQAEIGSDPAFGSVAPPLYTTSTYLGRVWKKKGLMIMGGRITPIAMVWRKL